MTSVQIEIWVVLPIALAFIGGLFVFALLAMFVLPKRIIEAGQKVTFPVEVKGYGMRFASPPPFDAKMDDIRRVLDLIVRFAVENKGYKKREVKAKLNGLRVTWMPSIRIDIEDDSIVRGFEDEFGRFIQGDHKGNVIRVAYLPKDKLKHIAFVHEICHELHELEGKTDYKHEDKAMWTNVESTVLGLL